ncbi:GGDEF domain-containing protein [Pseudomonas sp. NCHU5208]|uniref:GGDEF domain-containing protein n=1 Tax=unclassified Pseudomonas TaxID=196821 RepID=UPI003F96C8CB
MTRSKPHRQEGRPEIWQLAMRSCQLAAWVHFAFLVIFLSLDSPILGWVNVLSVAIYIYAYRALKQRRNHLAIMLIRIEVTAHAGLGTLMVGWESGFHYYLLLFIPALFVSMRARIAWIFAICLWAYYVGLDVLMWYLPPLQPISSHALLAVHIFNLTVVFCMFSYLALFHVVTVMRAHKELALIATTDPLTELFNRRHLLSLAEQALQQRTELTLMLMDIDHFKAINDAHGHEVGDQVLKAVSHLLKDSMRKQDAIGRWGGEEFLALLPHTDLEQAAASAERIREAVQALRIDCNGSPLSVTLSLGVSQHHARQPLSHTIARADAALYASKAAGRNRVKLATA